MTRHSMNDSEWWDEEPIVIHYSCRPTEAEQRRNLFDQMWQTITERLQRPLWVMRNDKEKGR